MKLNADERNFKTIDEIAGDLIKTINEWSNDRIIQAVVEFQPCISAYLNDFYHDYKLSANEDDEITEIVVDWFKDDKRVKYYYGIMYDNTISEIIEAFENDEELYNSVIEELDGFNGYLGDDRYYLMDEIDEIFSSVPASEGISRAFYGHDKGDWRTTATGEKIYAEFNPNRDYFTFNGYGNLVSTDDKDYSSYLDKWFIEDVLKNKGYISAIEDEASIEALFNKLERMEALK